MFKRVFFALLFFGCTNSGADALADYSVEVYSPEYATGFSILRSKEAERKSTVIEVQNPWQGAKGVATHLFIARNGESAPEGFDGQIVREGVNRIVCMSSTQIAMLGAVGMERCVVGVSGIDFISNEYIVAQRGKMADVGYDGSIDYELILSTGADLVLIYGMSSASPMEGKLKELTIPYLYIGEYLEESPLGKAEWLVAVAEIVNRREEAERIFSQMSQRYNDMKQSAKEGLNRDVSKRRVMINTPYGDAWVMAPNGSYMAQLIADAGGDYIYSSSAGSTKSQSIDVEEAYVMAAHADVWLNVGTISSLDELKRQLPKFADVPCVVRGEVYNSNKKVNKYGGDDYWESGVVNPDIVLRDLITIFNSDNVDESLVYYRKVK